MQFNLLVDGIDVLNPGSVGLPRDGDPRAAYAIIDDNRIELKRVAYPIERTIERIESMPWPERAKDMMSQILRTGRMPSPILEREAAASADQEAAATEE